MYIDRSLLDNLRKDFTVKRNTSNRNKDTITEIQKIIPEIEKHLGDSNVEKASNWMLYNDLWLQNESGHLKTNISYRNYSSGSVIMSVDWGTGNIGTEIRYPHPGVVLYDQGEDWVVVVPITGAKIDSVTNKPIFHPPFEVLAAKQYKRPSDVNEYWFQKHSVIQVDQIQRISKYRIINQKSYKIRENLLNQIENIVLEQYTPKKSKSMDKLKEKLDISEKLIAQKDSELIEANLEIMRLKGELEKILLKTP